MCVVNSCCSPSAVCLPLSATIFCMLGKIVFTICFVVLLQSHVINRYICIRASDGMSDTQPIGRKLWLIVEVSLGLSFIFHGCLVWDHEIEQVYSFVSTTCIRYDFWTEIESLCFPIFIRNEIDGRGSHHRKRRLRHNESNISKFL